MRCCKKSLSALLSGLLLAGLLTTTAHAEGISVSKAEIHQGDDGYHLSANYYINLNFVVKDALSRGIPIYFVGEFSLTHARWSWLDSAQHALVGHLPHFIVGDRPLTRWSWLDHEVFQSEQTFKISYSILTGRYRISRGALFQNFASLEDALNIVARQTSGVIPAKLLKEDDNYIAAARLSLDISQLPKPLQVNALTDSDWTLDSGWYRWAITPADTAVQDGSKTELPAP
ncbi:MAG: DUF4390 domain-containing protein [Gallionella sp.]